MYSKIDARFWTDEKILTLTLDAKLLMLYLLTSPHRNQIGCYVLPRGYAVEDLQMPYERFNAAWDELLATGMVVYDEKVRVILVRNFLRYNAIENPSQATSAVNRIADLPKSDIYIEVIETLSMLNKDYLKDVIDALKNLCINLVPDTVPNTLSDTLPDTVPSTLPDTVPDTNNNNNNNISISPPNPLTGGQRQKQASASKPIEVPFKEIQSLYNSTCSKLSKILNIDGSRRKAVTARFRHYQSLDIFRQLFEKANASAFLTGTNDRNWQADFDWLMKANNFSKVLEGKYDGSFNEVKKPLPKSKNFQQRKYTQEELSKMGHRIGVITDDDESN